MKIVRFALVTVTCTVGVTTAIALAAGADVAMLAARRIVNATK